ncbi:MAG: hypothetical protein H2038_03470 [Brevundimonas sp.]|uniref:hypothetical protein n=1 Tax=Brevundimonas sp. TaxID=1871086 RepID=UPI00182A7C7B|nr:hypothetical protein [Brevundimonas sp.]MBA4803694.1 hypothetical protein [Brevundimonas sp.]
MSAIRPPLTSPLFPTQPAPAPAPARADRASFFQAALERLAPVPDEAAAPPAPTAVSAPAAAAAAADRPARPGSLLDIRV